MKDKELFTVVVADDEDELREAVCKLIAWEDIGFKLVGSAGNGLDALQLVEQLQPDLLLTDIHMPFISGTSLAKQVREIQPLIQIAFLSGYDDFEFAKLAIEYEVIAYLLKPISTAELSFALQDIRGKMKAKFSYLSSGHESRSPQLLIPSLLMDSLAQFPPEDELYAALQASGLAVTAPYQLTVIATHIDGQRMSEGSYSIVDKVLRRYYSSYSSPSGDRILTLLISEDGFSRLVSALDELTQAIRRLLDSRCVIGVSRPFDEFRRCHFACREAIDAQRFAGSDGTHSISEMLESPPKTSLDESSAELARLMHSDDRRGLERYLAHAFSADAGLDGMAILQMLVNAREVLNSSLPKNETGLLLRRFELSDPFAAGNSKSALTRRISDLCISGQSLINERKRDGVSLLCGKAMRIIEQNYMDEDLSLGSVCVQLHVSPNYLSANMKKYTGDTFINLLIQKRMEAAQSLLSSGNMKIAEVARRCGYSDQHYFSFCFKKFYGISPAKMRRGDTGEAN